MPVFAVGLSPALLMPHRYAMGVIRLWAHTVLFGLRWLAGIKVVVTGLEHRPTGAALLAGKHQGMLDIVAPFTFLDDPCFVLKKELTPLPFFGWFAWKTKMIAVDRAAHSKALKDMVRQARVRLTEQRQILIFPEGTRRPAGAPPAYKFGVAHLYAEIGVPCVPVALNSGLFWPRRAFMRYPGTIVVEFLDPIPPGLPIDEFFRRLRDAIETATARLVAQGRAELARDGDPAAQPAAE